MQDLIKKLLGPVHFEHVEKKAAARGITAKELWEAAAERATGELSRPEILPEDKTPEHIARLAAVRAQQRAGVITRWAPVADPAATLAKTPAPATTPAEPAPEEPAKAAKKKNN